MSNTRDPLLAYIREHIDSAMYLARRVEGTQRRNLAADALAWNKLLVRKLVRERRVAAKGEHVNV